MYSTAGLKILFFAPFVGTVLYFRGVFRAVQGENRHFLSKPTPENVQVHHTTLSGNLQLSRFFPALPTGAS